MHFVSFTLAVAAIVFLVLAVLFVRAAKDQKAVRRVEELRKFLETAVCRAVLNFDRDQVFAAVVPVVLFLALPGAALLNAVLGGSPVLLNCYLLVAGSVLLHMLMVERPGWAIIAALLSGAGALSALLILPYYAVWSLTSHMLKGAPAEGALASTFIALIFYSANSAAWTLLHARPNVSVSGAMQRLAGRILAALPVGYVLYWFAVLALQVAGVDYGFFLGWAPLTVFSTTIALTVVAVGAVLDFGCRAPHWTYGPAFWSGGLAILAMTVGFAIN